jgi:hypothetical protein
MSDRVDVLTVILDQKYRVEDDLQVIVDAIKLLAPVRQVVVGEVSHDFLSDERARISLREKMMEILWPDRSKK